MRRYDDPVDVRRGRVAELEAPEQFVWRDRLWSVCEVVSHWVETGPWWEHRDVADLLGAGTPGDVDDQPGPVSVASLVAEREVWRVDAARGMQGPRGVFDLSFDWSNGQWRLTRCMD